MEKTTTWDRINTGILKSLEGEVVPWKQTWDDCYPVNYISGKPYRHLNILFLYGGETPYWLTWKQVQDKGGMVHPEETKNYRQIFFYRMNKVTNPKTEKEETYPVLRTYYVYNLSQTNLEVPNARVNIKFESAEDIISEYLKTGPKIEISSKSPSYYPQSDIVTIPGIEMFKSSTDYYAALFHELVHSTGHSERINRIKHGYFGDQPYSEEELVAEIGTCYLLAACGLSISDEIRTENSSYIQSWHKRLSNDPGIIKRALMSATKAVKLIMGDKYYA